MYLSRSLTSFFTYSGLFCFLGHLPTQVSAIVSHSSVPNIFEISPEALNAAPSITILIADAADTDETLIGLATMALRQRPNTLLTRIPYGTIECISPELAAALWKHAEENEIDLGRVAANDMVFGIREAFGLLDSTVISGAEVHLLSAGHGASAVAAFPCGMPPREGERTGVVEFPLPRSIYDKFVTTDIRFGSLSHSSVEPWNLGTGANAGNGMMAQTTVFHCENYHGRIVSVCDIHDRTCTAKAGDQVGRWNLYFNNTDLNLSLDNFVTDRDTELLFGRAGFKGTGIHDEL